MDLCVLRTLRIVTNSNRPTEEGKEEKNQLTSLFRLTHEFSSLFRNARNLPLCYDLFFHSLFALNSLQKHSTPELRNFTERTQ